MISTSNPNNLNSNSNSKITITRRNNKITNNKMIRTPQQQPNNTTKPSSPPNNQTKYKKTTINFNKTVSASLNLIIKVITVIDFHNRQIRRNKYRKLTKNCTN